MDYKSSGVDINTANNTKNEFKKILRTSDQRVMNKVGAFASLFDFSSLNVRNPVLVMKTEEPGSKQILAFEHDLYESVCFDMINHLVNDCVMMGAHPLIVQDCIVCGELQEDKVIRMVRAMVEACKYNFCTLVGGETSEQPGVIPVGTYVLSSSIVGVADKNSIIDGSTIKEGDDVIALSSNGPHTNGYTLIRAILKAHPELTKQQPFMSEIMASHRAYYPALRDLFPVMKGLAHITGGGIVENLNRILPSGLNALINLSDIKILEVFKDIMKFGEVPEVDMLRTFNLGVGVTAVVSPVHTEEVLRHLSSFFEVYKVGTIIKGTKKVLYEGELNW